MSETQKITANKCQNCGYIQHEDHLLCLRCKNDTFDIIEARGDCVLLTYTILNAPPLEFRDQKSYALGVVQFQNGIKTFGQITVKEKLYIGMKLEPKYKKICNDLNGREVYGHVFKPI
ncbi:MAG: hypothetical protein EU539_09290 [Promethearchaeota archaeon]|nr:MAG: hypothetical protein EU539_09290 [Candidatus Lokiarchaeota archaeon]